MNIKLLKSEDAENCKKKLELEIPVEDIQTKIEEIFGELQKNAAIPGFRPGHVPRKLLESRFSKKVRAQAIEDILPQAYEQIIKDNKYDPIGSPLVTDIQDKPDQPLQFKIEFEVRPAVQLGDYTNLAVKKRKIEITEDEINKTLENLKEQHAQFIPVTDRPVKEGDVLLIDFTGKMDGKKFEGGAAKNFSLELGKSQVLPEFEKALIGKNINDSTIANVKFPDDYAEKKLAGKNAEFEITIKEIKEKQLPNLDDEFAKDLGEYETLDQVKEKIKENIKTHKEQHEREHMVSQIMDQLTSQMNIDLPASLVDQYSHEIFVRNEFRMKQMGLTHNQLGTSPEKAVEQSVETAKKQIRISYILDAIAEKENITVSDEDIEESIAKIAKQNNVDPVKYKEALVGQKKLDSLRYELREEKVINYLLEKAKIEEI